MEDVKSDSFGVPPNPDDAPLASSEVRWLSFNGSPGESASTFVQSLQREAFLKGRLDEDHWIAQYASTSFGGDALLWYSYLDEDTRNSWSKLRNALLRQYRPIPIGRQLTNADNFQPTESKPHPWSAFSSQTFAAKLRGHVEVLDADHAQVLGYLRYEGTKGFSFGAKSHSTLLVTLLAACEGEASSIVIETPEASTSWRFFCLGLALRNSSTELPYVIPKPLLRAFDTSNYSKTFVISPSSLCGPLLEGSAGQVPIATWILRACSESSQLERHRRSSQTGDQLEKASAAVWRYDSTTNELGIRWLMEDNTEEVLSGFVVKRSEQIHFHRLRDANISRPNINEDLVKFYFVPDE